MIAPLRLRAEPLTSEAFTPFGFVMQAPIDGKRNGPLPVITDARGTASVGATLIHLAAETSPRRVGRVERHPHSQQFFLHLQGGNLSLVVMPAAADGSPDVAAARAFVAAPGQAFGYHPGTWHAGVAAMAADATVASLLSRDGTPDDVTEIALARGIEVDWT
jgi:ureidoglycolate lyase